MPLSIGAEFAGFTIERLLGSGGMGEIYLAQHPRLPRREAIKVLPAQLAHDADYRARFEREADLASKLWHPHIVGVHDRGETDGHLWIAMDYVDGLDAGQLQGRHHPAGMPVDMVVQIVVAVAAALDYAHRQGLLHRDVKPANIMLSSGEDREQRILLTDFGIARSLGDISGLTATNMTVGTLAFSAPEQLMGDDIDGRADQYALAATAYYLLTGAHLFPHSNPAAVISRHLNVVPPPLSASKSELAALDPVLARALAKDPATRFQTSSDFADALAHAATGSLDTQIAPAYATAAQSAPARAAEIGGPTARSRTWIAPTAVGVCVLAVAVAGVVFYERSRPAKSLSSADGAPTTSSLTAATSPVAPSSAPLLPTAPPTPTEPPARYGLPACYSIEDPPAERPTSVVFEFCGDGGTQLDHLTWTAWGPDGADGQGYFSVKTCTPNCALGGMAHFPAVIHATNPVALAQNTGCPTGMKFYTDLTLAFPTSSPDGLNGQTINSHYNGYPAIKFSTSPGQTRAMQLSGLSCW